MVETVGPKGTIMLPSFMQLNPNVILDYKTTPAYTGLIPEIVRKRSDSLRSTHPTHAVVALGHMAEHLTRAHDPSARMYLPYSTLTELGGKILCIGIGDNLVGFRHEVQDQAGLLDKVTYRRTFRYRNENGEVKKTYRRCKIPCVARLPELVNLLRNANLVGEGRVGAASSVLVPTRESMEILTATLKNDPTLNLCDSITCLWCRRLEWIMRLYGSIENPKFFQSNPLARHCLAAINWLRLKEIPLLIRLRHLRLWDRF